MDRENITYRESLRREETCVQEGPKGQCGWSRLSERERRGSGRRGWVDIQEFDVGGLRAGVLIRWEGQAVLSEGLCARDAGAPAMTQLGPNWAILCRRSIRAGVDCGKGRRRRMKASVWLVRDLKWRLTSRVHAGWGRWMGTPDRVGDRLRDHEEQEAGAH